MTIIRVATVDGEPVATYVAGYANGKPWTSEAFKAEHRIPGPATQGYCHLHLQPQESDLRALGLDQLTEELGLTALPIPVEHRHWAKVFSDVTSKMDRAERIKVGVVDCVHNPLPKDLEGVMVYDWASRIATNNLEYDIKSHGTDVCRILKTSLGGDLGQIDVAVFPLHAEAANGSFFIPEDVLAGAIDAAIDQGCRVINVSAGVPHFPSLGDGRVFDRVVKNALHRGVLIVAAGGNEIGEHVREPARYEEVLGVGMAGLVSHAVGDSYTALEMKLALEDARHDRRGDHPVLGPIFVAGAVGVGLNLVFPGCGLYCEGCTRMELHGSSFAAPVATRAVAHLYAGVDDLGSGGLARLWDRIRDAQRSFGVERWCSTLKLGQSLWPM